MWLIHILDMKQSLFLIKCSQMFISSDSKAHSEMLRCVKIRWVIRAQYINLSTTLDVFVDLNNVFLCTLLFKSLGIISIFFLKKEMNTLFSNDALN